MLRVVFLGSGDIGLPCLYCLDRHPQVQLVGVVSQPDRSVGRGLQLRTGPIATFAKEKEIPLCQPERLRNADAVATLKAMQPDLLVVMAYGQLLSPEVLAIPRIAPLNLHASLLPRHRGASPIQATLLAGDTETGITVMVMAEGLDTGDILLQKKLLIAEEETGGSLHDRLATLAAEALEEALTQILNQTAQQCAQEEALATFAHKLQRADGEIDWTESAKKIILRMRAFDPWPGVQTTICVANGEVKRIKIWKASLSDGELDDRQPPGTILEIREGGMTVATGAGAIRILEAQVEGRKRLAIEDLLRGFPVKIGAVLGMPPKA